MRSSDSSDERGMRDVQCVRFVTPLKSSTCDDNSHSCSHLSRLKHSWTPLSRHDMSGAAVPQCGYTRDRVLVP